MREIIIPYTPRDFGRELHDNPARFRVIVAHRGAGKSHWSINELIRAALTGPAFATYIYVMPRANQARRTVFDHVQRFVRPIPGHTISKHSMETRFPNGSKLMLLGQDDPESLRGLHVHGAVLDEVDDMSMGVWDIIRPTLTINHGFCCWIGTPKGRSELYKRYQMSQDPANDDWYGIMLPWWETGVLSEDEIEKLKAEMSPEMFAQELECFPPGSMVATGNDVVPIERLQAGDLVLTHTGRLRPVKRTMQKAYDGELLVIEAWGGKPLRLTPEHPVQVCNPSKQSYQWVKARDIQEDDWLVIPKKWIGLPIISPALAELIAWYVAEGSVNQMIATFSLGAHEHTFIERIRDCLANLGRESEVRNVETAVNVYCCDVALSDFLVANCGSGAGHKRLPLSLLAGHEQLVFDTLVDGDGHIKKLDRNGKPRTTWMYSTVSEKLVQQVQLLAASLNMGGTYTTTPAGHAVIDGREVLTRESYDLQVTKSLYHDDKRKDARIRCAKNGVLGRVHTISTQPYTGLVYNLSVAEDESYTVNNRAVHNCSFDAALVGAYYGRQLEELKQAGRIAYFDPPLYREDLEVHTCWDLGIRDEMAVWFYQLVGDDINFIDYEGHSNLGFPEWGNVIENKTKERGYRFGDFIAPHDVRNRELGTGVSRIESGAQYGLYFVKCPDHGVQDGIEMVRMALPKCRFDLNRCADGIEALKAYKSKLDKDGHPIGPDHSWASHCADSIRYGLTWVTQVVNQPAMLRVPLRRR